jgi:hypothetical protein
MTGIGGRLLLYFAGRFIVCAFYVSISFLTMFLIRISSRLTAISYKTIFVSIHIYTGTFL